MNNTQPWKRFLACACNHGNRCDPTSTAEVLRFKRAWKPHFIAHLGDNWDFAALRSGAKGTGDEALSLQDDLQEGKKFLSQLEPNLLFEGNHEARVGRLLEHPNAVYREAGEGIQKEIATHCSKLRAKWVPYDIKYGWRPMGDMLLGHGYMFSENALAKHATVFKKCAIGHLHVCTMAEGYGLDAPTAWCCGTLADIPGMSYARTRLATLRWSAGFLWGEYCEKEAVVWMSRRTDGGVWRSPL